MKEGKKQEKKTKQVDPRSEKRRMEILEETSSSGFSQSVTDAE